MTQDKMCALVLSVTPPSTHKAAVQLKALVRGTVHSEQHWIRRFQLDPVLRCLADGCLALGVIRCCPWLVSCSGRELTNEPERKGQSHASICAGECGVPVQVAICVFLALESSLFPFVALGIHGALISTPEEQHKMVLSFFVFITHVAVCAQFHSPSSFYRLMVTFVLTFILTRSPLY